VRPIYCTAVGKILAAWLPEGEIDDIIGRIVFKRLTANTITTPDALKRELARIRANGFAVDNEEHIEGIRRESMAGIPPKRKTIPHPIRSSFSSSHPCLNPGSPRG
jgi:DNA-binding IclR family transcriptional regulator